MKSFLKKEFALGYVIIIIICVIAGFFGGVWYVHHTYQPVYPVPVNSTCPKGYIFYAEPLNRCVTNTYYNGCFGANRGTMCPL